MKRGKRLDVESLENAMNNAGTFSDVTKKTEFNKTSDSPQINTVKTNIHFAIKCIWVVTQMHLKDQILPSHNKIDYRFCKQLLQSFNQVSGEKEILATIISIWIKWDENKQYFQNRDFSLKLLYMNRSYVGKVLKFFLDEKPSIFTGIMQELSNASVIIQEANRGK